MSPAFLVENEAEKRRGKKRMIVNYKAMNTATIGDSHNLPNKDELFTLIVEANNLTTNKKLQEIRDLVDETNSQIDKIEECLKKLIG